MRIQRATSRLPAFAAAGPTPFDTIILPHDGRYRRRITMRTENDFVFLLDLSEPTHLKHGDGLVLEDGRVIGVVAAEEPVTEIVADDSHHLARIAWHIGNRHVPAEILSDRIRILPDHTIEAMVRRLGGRIEHAERRFEPEGGAYGSAATHEHDHHVRRHSHEHPHGSDRQHHGTNS